jgi:hypothetical protein
MRERERKQRRRRRRRKWNYKAERNSLSVSLVGILSVNMHVVSDLESPVKSELIAKSTPGPFWPTRPPSAEMILTIEE